MKIKTLALVLLAGMGCLLLPFAAAAEEAETEENERLTCGFVVGSFDRIPDVLLAEGIEEEAQALDVQVKITDHSLDAEKAKEQIAELQEEGCQAIAIACTDTSNMKDPIEKAAGDGTAMFAFDTTLDSQEVCCVIGLDDTQGGRLGGEELLRLSVEGDEVAIIGFSSIPSGKKREDGALEVLKDKGRIVLTGYNYEGKTDRAKAVMDRILEEHPNVKAVFCVADLAAMGAFESIKEHASSCRIIGFNGNQEAWETMRSDENDGIWASEIAQDRRKIGRVLVDQMVKQLTTGQVDSKRIEIVPYVLNFEGQTG